MNIVLLLLFMHLVIPVLVLGNLPAMGNTLLHLRGLGLLHGGWAKLLLLPPSLLLVVLLLLHFLSFMHLHWWAKTL